MSLQTSARLKSRFGVEKRVEVIDTAQLHCVGASLREERSCRFQSANSFLADLKQDVARWMINKNDRLTEEFSPFEEIIPNTEYVLLSGGCLSVDEDAAWQDIRTILYRCVAIDVCESLPPERAGTVMGRAFGVISSFTALWACAGALIVGVFDWRAIYKLLAAFSAVVRSAKLFANTRLFERLSSVLFQDFWLVDGTK